MNKTDRQRKKVITVILTILIIITYFHILNFSFKTGETSAMQSMSFSESLVHFVEKIFSVNLNMTQEKLGQFEAFVRKAAHFFEYALLGFLVYSLPLLWGKESFKAAKYSFFAVALMAAIDELIQIFIPERAALVTDVMIDAAGCILGMLALRLAHWFSVKLKRGKYQIIR
ncbi:MAG: VanZ family protein [Lachnospiraceae bacterium]|nr:VanZ family protein [Lachnospiraceae bacterium]